MYCQCVVSHSCRRLPGPLADIDSRLLRGFFHLAVCSSLSVWLKDISHKGSFLYYFFIYKVLTPRIFILLFTIDLLFTLYTFYIPFMAYLMNVMMSGPFLTSNTDQSHFHIIIHKCVAAMNSIVFCRCGIVITVLYSPLVIIACYQNDVV